MTDHYDEHRKLVCRLVALGRAIGKCPICQDGWIEQCVYHVLSTRYRIRDMETSQEYGDRIADVGSGI